MAHSERFTVVMATRLELGDLATAISDWRTERYLDTGFYHRETVESLRQAGVAIETNRPDDYEIFAVTPDGRILATLSLRRPVGAEGHQVSDADRPWFGLEAVHGTEFLRAIGAIPADLCWEAGRFLRDRTIDCSDAVAAVAAAAAQLLARLAAHGLAALVVGEVERTVALRHLEAFGLPVLVGAEIDSPDVGGLLAGRYAGKKVVPFAVELSDISERDFGRWRALTGRSHLLKESTHVNF